MLHEKLYYEENNNVLTNYYLKHDFVVLVLQLAYNVEINHLFFFPPIYRRHI
jgi:hypothetical protein